MLLAGVEEAVEVEAAPRQAVALEQLAAGPLHLALQIVGARHAVEVQDEGLGAVHQVADLHRGVALHGVGQHLPVPAGVLLDQHAENLRADGEVAARVLVHAIGIDAAPQRLRQRQRVAHGHAGPEVLLAHVGRLPDAHASILHAAGGGGQRRRRTADEDAEQALAQLEQAEAVGGQRARLRRAGDVGIGAAVVEAGLQLGGRAAPRGGLGDELAKAAGPRVAGAGRRAGGEQRQDELGGGAVHRPWESRGHGQAPMRPVVRVRGPLPGCGPRG